jgi:hypothetical protein
MVMQQSYFTGAVQQYSVDGWASQGMAGHRRQGYKIWAFNCQFPGNYWVLYAVIRSSYLCSYVYKIDEDGLCLRIAIHLQTT